MSNLWLSSMQDTPISVIVRAFSCFLGIKSTVGIRCYNWESANLLFRRLSGLRSVRIEADLFQPQGQLWEEVEEFTDEYIRKLLTHPQSLRTFEVVLNRVRSQSLEEVIRRKGREMSQGTVKVED